MPNTTELELAAARLTLGTATAADLKAAAGAAVESGVVTSNLAELALLRDDTLAATEPLFRGALDQLNIEMPSVEDAAWSILRFEIRLIAEGITDPEQGLEAVMAVYYAAQLDQRSRRYAGDSHAIDPLLGLYWELDDVRPHKTEVDFDQKYGAVLQELRQGVTECARSWLRELNGRGHP